MGDLQVLRRSNVFKELTLDVPERSLIVHFSIESVLGDASGKMVNKEQSSQRKRIRLKDLSSTTDVGGLADAIMKSADMIPSTKKAVLVDLLRQLQTALSSGEAPAAAGKAAPKNVRSSLSDAGEAKDADKDDGLLDPTAKMAALDEYLEQLYEEDINVKVVSAGKILALAHKGENLQELVQNDVLLGALARVLKDDYKKSTELTLAIMQVFFCFAHFKEMHPFVVGARIGDLSLRIIDLEERRHTARVADLERFAALAEIQRQGDVSAESAFRAKDVADRDRDERLDAVAAAGGDRGGSDSKAAEETEAGRKRRKGKRAPAVPGEPNVGEDGKGDEGDGVRRLKLKPLPAGKIEIERELRKAALHTRRSEGLLYVCIHLLLNLAEELDLERKMCKRGIVGLLTPLLERDNAYLLLLVINFLRKLSIFEENKDAMVAQNVGPRLVAILPVGPDAVKSADTPGEVRTELFAAVLHLMFNLTFDQTMCQSFVTAGALNKVGAMLRASPYRAIGLKLLYRLSVENWVRGQFAGTDAVPLTFKMAAQFPGPTLPQELAALAVNLTQHPATAGAFMSKPDALKPLVARLIKTGDPAVAKILRGLSWVTYTCQADSEMKSHAQEDARRMRESALAKASKKKKKSKKGKKGKKGSKKGGVEGDGDPTTAVADMALDDAAFEEMITSHIGSYLPEPNEPLPYDYSFAGFWAAFVPDIVKLLLGCWERSDEASTVELLGCIANLTPMDAVPASGGVGKAVAPWSLASLASDRAFMHVLAECLHPGPPTEGLGSMVDPSTGQDMQLAAGCAPADDLLLEALQVVSGLALDPGVAQYIAAAGVPVLLAEILACRPSDPDVLMQAITAVLRLLHHPETREAIVTNTDVPARAADLLAHPHAGLAAEADDAVTLMIEYDREFGTAGLWRTLQARRFAMHNREWISAAVPAQAGPGMHPSSSRSGGATIGSTAKLSSSDPKPLLGASGSVTITGEAPDAYVEDSYGHEDDLDAAAQAQVAGLGQSGGPGSPLHHMGKHGEAVAFDVSYLLHATEGGAGGPARRQRSPSEIFDFVEDAIPIPGEEAQGEDEDEEDGEDGGTDGEGEGSTNEDMKNYMARYMGAR